MGEEGQGGGREGERGGLEIGTRAQTWPNRGKLSPALHQPSIGKEQRILLFLDVTLSAIYAVVTMPVPSFIGNMQHKNIALCNICCSKGSFRT